MRFISILFSYRYLTIILFLGSAGEIWDLSSNVNLTHIAIEKNRMLKDGIMGPSGTTEKSTPARPE